MAIPKIESTTFYQYLNIKRDYVRKSMKALKEIMGKNGKYSKEYIEAHKMLDFQKEELKEVCSLIRHEKNAQKNMKDMNLNKSNGGKS